MSNRKPIPLFPDFEGKVALVSGSSRGIGAETARYLALSRALLADSSAQAGVVMLTRNPAQQVGKSGVRENAIAPSTIRNDKIRKFMSQEQQQKLANTYAIPRLGGPADIAAAALFLGQMHHREPRRLCLMSRAAK